MISIRQMIRRQQNKQKTLGISKPNVANAEEKAHFEEKNLMTSIGEKCKLFCQISSIK